MFVDEGMLVVLRVAESGSTAWLTRRIEKRRIEEQRIEEQRFEKVRPSCARRYCGTCDGSKTASSKSYLVIQTEGPTGWEDWIFKDLNVEALLRVQEIFSEIKDRGTSDDCVAAS